MRVASALVLWFWLLSLEGIPYLATGSGDEWRGSQLGEIGQLIKIRLNIENGKLSVQRKMFCEKKTTVEKGREASEYLAVIEHFFQVLQ